MNVQTASRQRLDPLHVLTTQLTIRHAGEKAPLFLGEGHTPE